MINRMGHANGNARRQRVRLSLSVRALGWASLAGAGFLFGAVVGVYTGSSQLGALDLSETEDLSTVVLDREEHLLRAFTTDEGRWRLPVGVDDVDPRYLQILMAFEDRRFYAHGGVDTRAIARAALQAVVYRRLVSGASTLTMQVARLIERRHERSLARKLRQMVRALQLEDQFSKREILDLYLRLAPFGGNIEGIRAATLAYFGKEPKRLSLGQAALLVALPQSPESRRPDRFPDRARRARDRVLDVAFAAGVISQAEAARAKREAVPRARKPFPLLAPHLAEQEVAAYPQRKRIKTTLNRAIQKSLQALVRTQTRAMGEKLSAALLAIDNKTGAVLAYVGSSDYLDRRRDGAIDMVQAVRSPGSALKPFIYGLAFDAGVAHPETLIEDRRVRFGTYSPENFDDRFHGAVTLREALGQSLNVPAVKLLDVVGPARFVDRMQRSGVKTALPDGTKPSLAVALGGIGLRMMDLAELYAALARGGSPVNVTWRSDTSVSLSESKAEKTNQSVAASSETQALLSPVASWYVTDILRGAPVPTNFKSGQIAYKTGTSYGYRDAWAVGYNARYTVAVWVGRPDATSTPGLLGRTAAAPILFDAFQRLPDAATAFSAAPPEAVTASGANLPPPLKRFRSDQHDAFKSGPYATERLEIAFPPDRAALETGTRGDEPLVLKARGGVLPLTWLVNGTPIDAPPHRRSTVWTPSGPGFLDVSVLDANGDAARVHVRLK